MTEQFVTELKQRAEETLKGKKTYTDEKGLRHCAVCGAPLERILVGADGKPMLGGSPVVCICACDVKREEQERQEREARRRRDRAREMLRECPLYDPSYDRFTFDQDRNRDKEPFRQASRRCRDYVAHFEELQREGVGLLFTGPVGTGKSFYAASVVNALVEQGVPAIIVSTARLVNALRASKSPQELLDQLDRFALVALDDLGAERGSEYALVQMEALADQRALGGKPLIVTTNLSYEHLLKPTELRYQRLYDRIQALCCMVIPLYHGSLREAQGRTRVARCREIMGY